MSVLHEPRFADWAPAQVYAQLLDEGSYLCSLRTMQRLLVRCGEAQERRDQRIHPAYARPEPQIFIRPNSLGVRVHDIQVLGSETLHVPAGVVPGFDTVVNFGIQSALAKKLIAFSYPVPKIEGIDLQLFALSHELGGGPVLHQ